MSPTNFPLWRNQQSRSPAPRDLPGLAASNPAMAVFDAVGSTRHSRQPSFDEEVDNEISDAAANFYRRDLTGLTGLTGDMLPLTW